MTKAHLKFWARYAQLSSYFKQNYLRKVQNHLRLLDLSGPWQPALLFYAQTQNQQISSILQAKQKMQGQAQSLSATLKINITSKSCRRRAAVIQWGPKACCHTSYVNEQRLFSE